MKPNSRRKFFQKAGAGFATLTIGKLTLQKYPFRSSLAPALYFTNGFKIAEVSNRSALIWTRLCGQEKPNPVRHQRIKPVFRHPIAFDENGTVDQMDGAVKGTSGWVRALVSTGKTTLKSDWMPAVPENDYTVQLSFNSLKAATKYQLTLEAKATEKGEVVATVGTFTTAPDAQSVVPVQLTTSTCQYFWSFDDEQRGFKTYDSMGRMKPDFFIHTGDYIYYDKPGPLATNSEKARHKWHAMNGWPSLRDFLSEYSHLYAQR